MPNLTTFGWEQEFESGAAELTRELYDRELVRDAELHSYHCDCRGCMGSHPLHAQHDSSCSGEIISRVYAHGSLDRSAYEVQYHVGATEIFPQVQEAAVAVDAEPGYRAGFHVHVGITQLPVEVRADALWAFLKWEPVLQVLASGRYESQRDGMNSSSRSVHNGWLQNLCRSYGLTIERGGITALMVALEGNDDFGYIKNRTLEFNNESDRHSNLNTRTANRQTFEYRLWNSTRSAWRCDLFTRLTVALVDPVVVEDLNEVPGVARFGNNHAEALTEILAGAGHDRAAELAQRQFDYATRVRENASIAGMSLTIV